MLIHTEIKTITTIGAKLSEHSHGSKSVYLWNTCNEFEFRNVCSTFDMTVEEKAQQQTNIRARCMNEEHKRRYQEQKVNVSKNEAERRIMRIMLN